MIWPLTKKKPKLDHSALALDPFITAALEGQATLDEPQSRRLIESYIYGAIRYLASYDDLSPENSKVLLQKMLLKHFERNQDEVNKSLKHFSDAEPDKTEQLFMIEGASALRRWLVRGDRNVMNDLKELLEVHN